MMTTRQQARINNLSISAHTMVEKAEELCPSKKDALDLLISALDGKKIDKIRFQTTLLGRRSEEHLHVVDRKVSRVESVY